MRSHMISVTYSLFTLITVLRAFLEMSTKFTACLVRGKSCIDQMSNDVLDIFRD